jgi:hypothetical protein
VNLFSRLARRATRKTRGYSWKRRRVTSARSTYRVHRTLVDQSIEWKLSSTRNMQNLLSLFLFTQTSLYLPMKSSLPGSSSYTSNSIESLSYCSTTNSKTYEIIRSTRVHSGEHAHLVPFRLGGIINGSGAKLRIALCYREREAP